MSKGHVAQLKPPGPEWDARTFVRAHIAPGLIYGRLTIVRAGQPDLVFKRSAGCTTIIAAINRSA